MIHSYTAEREKTTFESPLKEGWIKLFFLANCPLQYDVDVSGISLWGKSLRRGFWACKWRYEDSLWGQPESLRKEGFSVQWREASRLFLELETCISWPWGITAKATFLCLDPRLPMINQGRGPALGMDALLRQVFYNEDFQVVTLRIVTLQLPVKTKDYPVWKALPRPFQPRHTCSLRSCFLPSPWLSFVMPSWPPSPSGILPFSSELQSSWSSYVSGS